ncbi:MAG: nitroreductase family protein [Chloroflexota bacterium]
MDYDSLMELLKSRRTIRRFKPDPVPDDYVDKIIEAARWAPSGFNMQPWDFIIIKDKKLKDAIVGYVHEYYHLTMRMEARREEWQRVPHRPVKDQEMDYKAAPVYILLLGDTRTNRGLPTAVRYDAERTRTIFTSTLANAYLYMTLAATTLGLANEWVSSVASPYPQGMTRGLLGIPPEMEIYDMMALGYPAYKLSSRKLLRDKAGMVHHDYCGPDDFRTQEEVNDFIKRARVWTTANHRRGVDKKMVG